MRRVLCVMAIMVFALLQAEAQMQDRGGRNLPPGENISGKVTAVGKDSLTIAPSQGAPVTIKISDTTRVTKNRQPFKLEDIKADEMIFARGELKDGVMQAAIVAVINPEMAQRFQGGGGMGGMRGGGRQMQGFQPEDLGKKFIIGQVKAINETKLTIARPDGQTQDIEVDENTSFKKDNQSVTLPDIKVGDFVRGQGALKGDTFIPKELIVGGGGQMRRMRQGNQEQDESKPTGAPPAAPATPAATPAPAANPK